jgi:hypothetical protein
MRIKNQKDFWAGVMFIGFGSFFAGFGTEYTFGSADRMGPGYFPTLLGIIVIVLGIIVAISGLSPKAEEEKVDKFDWRTLFFVLFPIVLFGLVLNSLGLIVALFLLVMISSYAGHEFRWKEALVNSVVLIVLCFVIFVYALKLQFPLLPTFIGS